MYKRVIWLVVSCFIVAAVLLTSCGGSAPAAKTGAATAAATSVPIIKVLTSPFGTGTYAIFSGMETLTQNNPKIRISNVETPGAEYCVKTLCNEKAKDRWKDQVIMLGDLTMNMAAQGIGLFTEKYPMVNDFLALTAHQLGIFGLVTLNKDLTDPKKLEGKRIALGTAAQAWWAFVPEAELQAIGVKYQKDYLGPEQAMQALLDGRADAAVVGGYASGDYSVFQQTPSLISLVASNRQFYYVKFTGAQLQPLTDKYGFLIREIPAKTFPSQPDPIFLPVSSNGINAHKSFSEELAYQFAKAMLDNYKELPKYTAQAQVTIPVTMVTGYKKEIYHPGAIRAYKEAGVWKD